MTDPTLTDVIDQLAKSAKYANLCPSTLERIAIWALARHDRPKDAAKAGKRKLHQVFGAYLDPGAVAFAERRTAEVGSAPSRQALKDAATDILRHHASSNERLAYLAALYDAIWQITGQPRRLLDLACGFSPFALPFMGLDAACRYDAIDIDVQLAATSDRFRALFGQPGRVMADDILVHRPKIGADIALFLKTLPCLEQQETGAGARLLGGIDARAIVVSYPTKSLGGRQKGMAQTYGGDVERLAVSIGRRLQQVDIEGELVFVLTHL